MVLCCILLLHEVCMVKALFRSLRRVPHPVGVRKWKDLIGKEVGAFWSHSEKSKEKKKTSSSTDLQEVIHSTRMEPYQAPK